MQKFNLNGEWKLYPYKEGQAPLKPSEIKGDSLTATVPGNVETALIKANVLPDIYKNDNVEKARAFELYDWWYVKDFQTESLPTDCDSFLVFEGVDTYAEYYLNGVKIGESDNMLISHEFLVDGVLKVGANVLAVHVFSAIKKAEDVACAPSMVADWECFSNIRTRKPAHAYGWDIYPRLISAGIWRDVNIEFRPKIRIEEVYLSTVFAKKDLAGLCFYYNLKMPSSLLGKLTVELLGKTDGGEFAFSYNVSCKAGTKFPYVQNPVLWWPNGMGNPSLYDVEVALYDDNHNLLDKKALKFGIRHIKLERKDFKGENGFRFLVNEEPILCKGANWIPLDVMHSKCAEKYESAVLEYKESNSNMLRVWGGGIYEGDEFYELCDRYGIMVWQDVMLACHAYPQDESFQKQLYAEVESVVKRIRNHPSIALYCGSNETDWIYFCTGQNPNDDVLTRKVIPDAIRYNDPYRVYYPTTPMFTHEFTKKNGGRFLIDLDEIEKSRVDLPEEHYWWHRDDYKTYANMQHNFVGEIGYSACPNVDSLKKFLDVDKLTFENEFSGEAWKKHDYPTDGAITHSTKYYFGEIPSTLEDFALSSQIGQAEAYKFLIEHTRIKKPYMTGVLLWVMRDGWPSYNSGVVDYYGARKLAFEYIKRAQQPLVMAINSDLKAYVLNDSLNEYSGKYSVLNSNGETLKEGEFSVGANQNLTLGQFDDLADEEYLILKLTVENTTYYNHYSKDLKSHNFARYKAFLQNYKKIANI